MDDTTPPVSDALGQAVDETASQRYGVGDKPNCMEVHGLKRYGKMCINYSLPIQGSRSM